MNETRFVKMAWGRKLQGKTVEENENLLEYGNPTRILAEKVQENCVSSKKKKMEKYNY